MSQVTGEFPFGDANIAQRRTEMPFRGSGLPAVASWIAIAAALLALMPLVSLVVIAVGGETGDIWDHLIRYVVPTALWQTALLLAGVAAVTVIVGVGTAWAVTTFSFPGRDALIWLLPLPLAIPTYIVAYVYVDILDALGPVQSALRALFGWRSAADYWFPNVRSLGGAIFVIGFVLYPYVYLAARAMFQTQAAPLAEAARDARRAAVAARAAHHAAAGAAGHRGRPRAGAARNAQRHRRERISRRADAHAVDLHHLAQPQQPARAPRRSPASCW